MSEKIINKLEEKLKLGQIKEVINLYEEGNTIPFMARYRKELTGNKDEVVLKEIIDLYESEKALESRKESVKKILKEQDNLTSKLEAELNNALSLKEVETIYSPYKVKKSRKIEKALSIGLDKSLNKELLKGEILSNDEKLEKYIEKQFNKNTVEFKDKDEVKELVKELVKEDIVKNNEVRKEIKKLYEEKSFIVTKLKDKEKDKDGKYEIYYNYREEVNKIKGHRLLAIEKAEKDGVIKVSYEIDRDGVIETIENKHFNKKIENSLIKEALKESYTKRLKVSLESELEGELKEKSDNEAIKIFEKNLERLLMMAPIKNKRILSLDPAYRTGCKLAILDENGNLLGVDVIYPHEPKNLWVESKNKLINLINKYKLDLICVGNGTASRESETLVRELIKESKININYIIVNESGASVYSASEEARREFGNLPVEQRSAISLGRRVLDPLSELVKIDPKSIGVGQYQHLVNEKDLSNSLDFVVERVVNKVGVDLNTASSSLLQYVSGLNKTIAENIVNYREENGGFKERKELLKVPKLGKKTYEQCAGFLRIYDGKNKLDGTGIHPEDYKLVKELMKKYNIDKKDIGNGNMSLLENMDNEKEKYLLEELLKEKRDIREDFGIIQSEGRMKDIEDLKEGNKIEGEVRSVVSFGAFVDIGLKNDAFIHISKLSNKFITNPLEILNVGDIKEFKILEIDKEKNKVSLTLK